MPRPGLPDDVHIFQDGEFDPMEILHEHGGKIPSKSSARVSGFTEDDNDEEEDQNPPPAKKTSTKTAKAAPEFELKDDVYDALLKKGLAKTGGLELEEEDEEEPEEEDDEDQDEDQDDEATDDDEDDEEEKGKTGPQLKKQVTTKGKAGKADTKSVFTAHYNSMVQLGRWKEVEGFDGSEEKYLEAINTNDEERVNAGIDEFIEDALVNNPDGKALGKKWITHLARGGTAQDFVDLYAQPATIDLEAIDDKDEEVAEQAAERLYRAYHQELGWKVERIDARLAKIKKAGSLIEEAQDLKEPYTELVESRQQEYEQQQLRVANARKQKQRQLSEGLNTLLKNGHKFGNLPVYADDKERRIAEARLFKPNENGITEFRSDLSKNLEDPEFVLFLETAMRKQLHKKPELLGGAKGKTEKEVKSSLRNTLESSLLNNQIRDKTAKSPVQSSNTDKSRKKQKGPVFDMDSAIVIH
jgi:hypothetical protein